MKNIYTASISLRNTGRRSCKLLLIAGLYILFLYPQWSGAATAPARWVFDINLKTAIADNDQVKVEWEVMESDQPQYYALEKSVDGVNYNEVYRVVARMADNNNDPVVYEGTDSHMSPGLSYYRVSRIDANGNAFHSYSIAFGNENVALDHFASIDVYPNPFVDYCCVKLSCKEDMRVNLIIAGPKGRTHYSMDFNCTKGENVFRLDLRDKMLRGIYFMRVVNIKTGESIFERVVKNDN
jgi:hypothetical protein